MATTAERLGIVETKVVNLDEKIDEIKVDVNQLGAGINSRLDHMYDASCTQHAELAKSIKSTHTELDAKISYSRRYRSSRICVRTFRSVSKNIPLKYTQLNKGPMVLFL
jgi:hypothetical protein